jgi:hypothetical protein
VESTEKGFALRRSNTLNMPRPVSPPGLTPLIALSRSTERNHTYLSACFVGRICCDLFDFRRRAFAGFGKPVHRTQMTSSWHDSHDLAVAFRVLLLSSLLRLLVHHRSDERVGETPPSVSFSRPFDVYLHKAATYTELRHPAVQRSRPFKPASRSWPSTLYSAPCLPTVFQAGTPLGLRVFKAFPFATATRDSSPRASLHALSLEPPSRSKLPLLNSSRSFEGLSHRKVRIHPEHR